MALGMDVLMLATGQDTAGMGGRIASAFARVQPWVRVKSVTGSTNYMAYGGSTFMHRKRDIEKLYHKADIVHLRNTFHGVQLYGRHDPGKPIVIHHHGTIFREDGEDGHRLTKQAKALKAVQLVSTVDLLLYGDGEPLTWMPSPYNADYLKLVRDHNFEPHGKTVVIAHAPTNREIKGTDAVIAAVERLKDEGYPVEFDLIERQTNKVCLARKAKADIFIDQLILGYGCNAIEAWGMGIPVVAGVTDPAVRAKMLEVWGKLPFVEANRDNLYSVLKKLVTRKAARAAAAELGAAHFAKWHDERVVVPRLRSVYERIVRRH